MTPDFDQQKFEHWVRLNTMRQLAEWLAEQEEPHALECVLAFAYEQGWVERDED